MTEACARDDGRPFVATGAGGDFLAGAEEVGEDEVAHFPQIGYRAGKVFLVL